MSRDDWSGVAAGADRLAAGGAVKCTAPGRSRGWRTGSAEGDPDSPEAAGDTAADPMGGADAGAAGDTAADPLGGPAGDLTALANADHGESRAGVCGRRRCSGGTGLPGGAGVGADAAAGDAAAGDAAAGDAATADAAGVLGAEAAAAGVTGVGAAAARVTDFASSPAR
ncbi:hypothetical protein ABNF97_26200 [Plantactinospora sp. B6F1]|uniref:hypothetical protein n=1 Tax=Plantactinospora sp. B6F1 TaxID=3158971 RepID=UPI0032D8E29D